MLYTLTYQFLFNLFLFSHNTLTTYSLIHSFSPNPHFQLSYIFKESCGGDFDLFFWFTATSVPKLAGGAWGGRGLTLTLIMYFCLLLGAIT